MKKEETLGLASSLIPHPSSLCLSAVPIPRIVTAVVGAEGIADGNRGLEVTGIVPTIVRLLSSHGPMRACGPIGVPRTRHDPKTGEKVAVATTIAASPSGCFLLS